MTANELKAAFAEGVYREYLHENYGIESCGFKGYSSLNNLYLHIFLADTNYDCVIAAKEVESVKLCSCTPIDCNDYDPYRVCSCKYK